MSEIYTTSESLNNRVLKEHYREDKLPSPELGTNPFGGAFIL